MGILMGKVIQGALRSGGRMRVLSLNLSGNLEQYFRRRWADFGFLAFCPRAKLQANTNLLSIKIMVLTGTLESSYKQIIVKYMEVDKDFFARYYIGHKGAYGHEYLDFQIDWAGRLKYFNNSEYKSDSLISKEAFVSPSVVEEMKRIIQDSGILEKTDQEWPKPDKIGKQELHIRMGNKTIKMQTSKIGSFSEIQKTADPEGMTCFFYLVQDLKCFVFSLVNMHFRIKPI